MDRKAHMLLSGMASGAGVIYGAQLLKVSTALEQLSIYVVMGVVLGAFAGTVPDLDIAVRGYTDPNTGERYPMSKDYRYALLIYFPGAILVMIINSIIKWKNGGKYAHRYFTHSLMGWLIFSFGVLGVALGIVHYYPDITSYMIVYAFAGVVGYLFHLIADMLTYSGVALFFPLSSKKYGLLPRVMRGKNNDGITAFYLLLLIFLIFAPMWFLFKE